MSSHSLLWRYHSPPSHVLSLIPSLMHSLSYTFYHTFSHTLSVVPRRTMRRRIVIIGISANSDGESKKMAIDAGNCDMQSVNHSLHTYTSYICYSIRVYVYVYVYVFPSLTYILFQPNQRIHVKWSFKPALPPHPFNRHGFLHREAIYTR